MYYVGFKLSQLGWNVMSAARKEGCQIALKNGKV